MSRTVYHLLTETDSFSDLHGAALQRWVANVMKFEAARAVVVCARADSTWPLPHVTARKLPALGMYSKLRGRYRLPWSMRQPLLRAILQPALADLKPGDVVWIHNRPDYAGAIQGIVRASRARLVVHLHNSLMVSFPEEIVTSFDADRIVFCSKFLAQEARTRFPRLGNISVIYNGADESRFFPERRSSRRAKASRPLVLFAGRLVREKGAHIFAQAMRILETRGIPAAGRILGASGFGSSNPATRYVKDLRRIAPCNIEFAGYCSGSALAEEFRRADIFTSPSIWDEPFGLVNVEAMASGLATVSTNAGGVPEVFADGGAVLVARNSPQKLAEAIETLVRDGALRERIATEGYRNFKQNFTWRAVHKRYEELLGSLP